MIRALALAPLAALAVHSAADAEPRKLPKSYATLEAGKGWTLTVSEAPADSKPEGALATAVHDSGAARARVVRVNVYNTPAWRKQKHYFTSVLDGLKSSTPGFALSSQRQSRVDRVPVLDVRYRREHASEPYVVTRFVFFRTFTLIISVTSDRARRKTARALARSLVPDL